MSKSVHCYACLHSSDLHPNEANDGSCKGCIRENRPFPCATPREFVSDKPSPYVGAVTHHVQGHQNSCRCSGCKAETLWTAAHADASSADPYATAETAALKHIAAVLDQYGEALLKIASALVASLTLPTGQAITVAMNAQRAVEDVTHTPRRNLIPTENARATIKEVTE
jgi:hypothetical protein